VDLDLVVVGLKLEVDEPDLDAVGLAGAGEPELVLLKLGVASVFQTRLLYPGKEAKFHALTSMLLQRHQYLPNRGSEADHSALQNSRRLGLIASSQFALSIGLHVPLRLILISLMLEILHANLHALLAKRYVLLLHLLLSALGEFVGEFVHLRLNQFRFACEDWWRAGKKQT
jgi:hypothetical protein